MLNLETAIIPSDFQNEVLAFLLKDQEVMAVFSESIQDEYFENPINRDVYQIAKSFFREYKKLPTRKILEREISERIRKNPKRTLAPIEMYWRVIETLYSSPVTDKDYIIGRIKNYLLRAQLALIGEQAIEQSRRENIDIDFFFRSLGSLFQTVSGKNVSKSEFLLADAEKRERKDFSADKLPMGWRVMDGVLGGGLGKGEIGVIMAPTGYGKSHCLISIGAHALKLQKKVLHVTLELSAKNVIRRYESLLLSLPKEQLLSNSDRINKILKRTRRLVSPADILIMEFPMKSLSVEELRAIVNQMTVSRNFSPDLLIVDYADIMKPLPHSKEDRRDVVLAATYERLRGLAQELEIPVWTGSQANKKSMAKEIMTVADISESFAKAQVADVVIAICRTHQEIENHKGRFYFAKTRETRGNLVVPFKEDFDRGRIWEAEDAVAVEAPPSSVDFSSEGESDEDIVIDW